MATGYQLNIVIEFLQKGSNSQLFHRKRNIPASLNIKCLMTAQLDQDQNSKLGFYARLKLMLASTFYL